MKKLSQLAAVLALGSACALPVMAQDTNTTTGSSTQSTQAPATQTMGAGPEDMETRDEGRDMGWLGLLGLAGLLGMRRKHHDTHDHHRTTAAH